MRMSRNSFYLVAAVLVTAAATLFKSCGITVPKEDKPEVSIAISEVGGEAGQMFVNVKCQSAWTLSLETDSADAWANLSATSGTGDKANVVLTYTENTTGNSRTLTIVLKSGTSESSCSLLQTASGEKPGTGPVQGQPELAKVKWLEMPALDNPNLKYYSHNFTMDSKTYRNYSFGFSSKDGVAYWVAYPLCKFYTVKNVQRTDAWALDPLLGDDSPAPFGGYAEELARGHQLPSADRLCCKEANEQTFYGSNMTPQLNEHNEGIWANLESSVRTWANTSDTTYVVTGCIVEGCKRITTDSNGRDLSVPVTYYKAILRYHKSSTIAQWAAAGFYLWHRDYGKIGIAKEHSMSIDELEKITGIDFFVNLPEKIGAEAAAQIEAQDPATCAIWW